MKKVFTSLNSDDANRWEEMQVLTAPSFIFMEATNALSSLGYYR